VILDVAMPGLDGWATLERIREVSDVPVLMLTARDGELERVRGLKGGADDYVVKPFGRQELVARVDALLRRPRSRGAQDTYADARLSISLRSARALRRPGGRPDPSRIPVAIRVRPAPESGAEQRTAPRVVWGNTTATSRDEVKLYVGYLRRKLDPTAPGSTPIETVRGFGYRYKTPV
jgi:DNA-binding response OmpR family regulator